jgi:hypothetical protein
MCRLSGATIRLWSGDQVADDRGRDADRRRAAQDEDDRRVHDLLWAAEQRDGAAAERQRRLSDHGGEVVHEMRLLDGERRFAVAERAQGRQDRAELRKLLQGCVISG